MYWRPSVLAALVFTASLTQGCARTWLSADDAILTDDGYFAARAFVERQRVRGLRNGIEDLEVDFLVAGQPIGDAVTGDYGDAVLQTALAHRTPTRFEARADYRGRTLDDEGRVFVWSRDRTAIVLDIDNTISHTHARALFFGDTDTKSYPLADAQEVIQELAASYHILYLTARPRQVVDKTRAWLADQGFPDGPVITAASFGDIARQRRYKTRMLRGVTDALPNVLIGIGNTNIDSEAYGENGMLALIVDPEDKRGYRSHAIAFRDWKSIRAFFALNEDTLREPPRLTQVLQEGGALQLPVTAWQPR